ncbi:MAG: ATP-binding protein [Bacteroidia bacterium]|nr:ATP-binding protein [Bacteroidia bacterium]
MRLKAIKLKNFRGYRNLTPVNLNDLSVFIGKNDSGKSSILEALEIFFNNSIVRIEKEDLNVDAKANEENKIEITCVFNQLPSQLIIDAANPTTLTNEYLLNNDGDLEIKKVYTCGAGNPKEQVYLIANHPTINNGNDLLLLKKTELRARATQLGIPAANYNGNINSTIRTAIWNSFPELNLGSKEIQVDKEEAKEAWEYLKKWMPQFALFKSDRESNDADKEITDPMKIAVNSAIAELSVELELIQERVMSKAIEVASRTLDKLREMNPALASQLTPDFKAEPKWASLFSLTLSGDKDIPINKRGSGFRRLIILNFFRAEAERRRNDNNSKAIIYAFEEPENSQHPDHQEMLIKAFQELADSSNTQVFITTHNPALAGLVNENDLRLITLDAHDNVVVLDNQQNIMKSIADTLGMLPEPLKPKLLICVEGPHDVTFFNTISAIIHINRNDLPDLSTDTRVAIFPLGGGTLKDWVTNDYLHGLEIPQYHIYDLDDPVNPPYRNARDLVRAKGGQNWAELTAKKELENYIDPSCIQVAFGFPIAFGDMDDVPELVARIQHNQNSPNPWIGLDEDYKRKKISKAKRRLNNDVARLMTWPQIQAADPNGDLIRWLEAIRDRIQ